MKDVDLTGRASTLDGSQPLRGVLATPAGDGPWPGVVVLHEAFGVDDVMRRLTSRMADAGYLSLAVDLFSAGGTRRCLVSTMRAMITGQGRAFADIEAARGWLIDSPSCTGKVGVIGFCLGGGFALLTAGAGFDAASVNYGKLPADVDKAMAGACPVVASYGGRDVLRGSARKLEAALDRADVPHDVKEYPSAGHSFLNDAEVGPRLFRPLARVANIGPEPVAAADAWRRIDAFFAEHLK